MNIPTTSSNQIDTAQGKLNLPETLTSKSYSWLYQSSQFRIWPSGGLKSDEFTLTKPPYL